MRSGETRGEGRAVTGARHLREGRPCQDALEQGERSGAFVMAVADGHGSSPRGGEGARLAVRVAVDSLLDFHDKLGPEFPGHLSRTRELMREPVSRALVQAWAQRVRESAGGSLPEEELLREHGTTLLAALVAPAFALFLQVGDGDILFTQGEGLVERGVEPGACNFADETESLCTPQAWLSMRIKVWPPFDRETLVLLATDGYSKSYASTEDFERIGPDYLAWVRERGLAQVGGELEAILEETSRRGSGDDITLGLIHLPAPEGVRESPDVTESRGQR